MGFTFAKRSREKWIVGVWLAGIGAGVVGALGLGRAAAPPTYMVAAYNDLGMHCMQNDFSQMMILPPYNTLHAQVIRRAVEPEIITQGVTVGYELPSNTHSSDKTNFWAYAQALLGAPVPPDVGVAGFGMSGTMAFVPSRGDYEATGIPVTPIEDDGRENPYPLALVTVRSGATVIGQTQAVVPVSWEMSCNLCHSTPGESVATSILKAHDKLHATNLINSQPVMCASCHADNALGAAGQPGVSNLSAAMHGAHAPRMGQISLANSCYACHPGVRTTCQRDLHTALGKTCTDCHGGMAAVGNPARNPWVDVPRCADCHHRAEFDFEQPGKRYRDSVGHGGVQCMTCHGSPHAMGTATTATDNAQAIRLQGHAGVLNTCTVCHTTPPGAFEHKH